MTDEEKLQSYIKNCKSSYRITDNDGNHTWIGEEKPFERVGDVLYSLGMEWKTPDRIVAVRAPNDNCIDTDLQVKRYMWVLYDDREELDMNEQWAKDAIKEGRYAMGNQVYKIVKEPHGQCNDCHFLLHPMPDGAPSCGSKAVTICCTGGVIFKKMDENEQK